MPGRKLGFFDFGQARLPSEKVCIDEFQVSRESINLLDAVGAADAPEAADNVPVILKELAAHDENKAIRRQNKNTSNAHHWVGVKQALNSEHIKKMCPKKKCPNRTANRTAIPQLTTNEVKQARNGEVGRYRVQWGNNQV